MKLKSRSVPKRVRGKRGPRPRNSVTLKMVAREAGVSASTASRIINRTVDVSDELRLNSTFGPTPRRGAWRWAGL